MHSLSPTSLAGIVPPYAGLLVGRADDSCCLGAADALPTPALRIDTVGIQR
jgi:hypothetical protein